MQEMINKKNEYSSTISIDNVRSWEVPQKTLEDKSTRAEAAMKSRVSWLQG